ncbi:hypothetical protein HanPI659440_Chr17g0679021 [Helianthus annuus]|nr:hypothetical protein HanPI659440_Chr17g0679021 [Helianthus annuus]
MEGFGTAQDRFGLSKGLKMEFLSKSAPAKRRDRRRRTYVPSGTAPFHPTPKLPVYGQCQRRNYSEAVGDAHMCCRRRDLLNHFSVLLVLLC